MKSKILLVYGVGAQPQGSAISGSGKGLLSALKTKYPNLPYVLTETKTICLEENLHAEFSDVLLADSDGSDQPSFQISEFFWGDHSRFISPQKGVSAFVGDFVLKLRLLVGMPRLALAEKPQGIHWLVLSIYALLCSLLVVQLSIGRSIFGHSLSLSLAQKICFYLDIGVMVGAILYVVASNKLRTSELRTPSLILSIIMLTWSLIPLAISGDLLQMVTDARVDQVQSGVVHSLIRSVRTSFDIPIKLPTSQSSDSVSGNWIIAIVDGWAYTANDFTSVGSLPGTAAHLCCGVLWLWLLTTLLSRRWPHFCDWSIKLGDTLITWTLLIYPILFLATYGQMALESQPVEAFQVAPSRTGQILSTAFRYFCILPVICGWAVFFGSKLSRAIDPLIEGLFDLVSFRSGNLPVDGCSLVRISTGGSFKEYQNSLEDRLIERLKIQIAFQKPDIVVAHSLGSVLALKAIAGSTLSKPLLLTMGSPLKLIQQYYPDENYLDADAGKRILLNLFRTGDLVGEALGDPEGNIEIADLCLGPGGHSDYFKDPKVAEIVLDILALSTATNDNAALAEKVREMFHRRENDGIQAKEDEISDSKSGGSTDAIPSEDSARSPSGPQILRTDSIKEESSH